MKKFGLFISIALLFAFVGCDNDDVEDPGVPTVAKPVIAISENTPTSFGVEWDAVDQAAEYQYAVTQSDAEGNSSEFCPEAITAGTSVRFDNAAAGMKYTVKVKALAEADSQLADSEYAAIFVETPAEGISSLEFTFTIKSAGYDSATVTVKPSIADEKYYFAVVKSASLVDKNSNAIIEMLKKDIDPASLVKGEQTIEKKWLDPETGYVAVAFGYDADKGASTSLLGRSEKFTTGVDPRMSIDLSILSAGNESISAKCSPSDSRTLYYVTAVSAASVGNKADRDIQTDLLKAINADIAKSGWDAVAAAQFRTGTSSFSATGLTIGTEYYVVAFGVTKAASGTAEEVTRLFKTKAKTSAPEALVGFSLKIIDGSQLVEPQVGKAAVGFQFSPNAATKSYAYGVFKESILEGDYADSDLIAMMTGDPATMIDPATDADDNFRGYYVFEWGERAVVMTVGLNAIGQPGKLQKELIEITKDGGGPSTPVERCDASVGMKSRIYKTSKGEPASDTSFTPSSDCAKFRFMVALSAGFSDSVSENELISIFNDESYNAYKDPNNGIWYDSSILGNKLEINGVTYFDRVLGGATENISLAYNAEGVAGKIMVETLTWPGSIDDLPSASNVPTSSMIYVYRQVSAIQLLNRTHAKRYDLK